jgi:hypothetical protein
MFSMLQLKGTSWQIALKTRSNHLLPAQNTLTGKEKHTLKEKG